MEEKINILPYVAASAAILAATTAVYLSHRPRGEKNQLRPFEEFLKKSSAVGRLTINNIAGWFKEDPLYNDDACQMIIAYADKTLVNYLGYEYNSEADPESCIIQAFSDIDTHVFKKYRVISFGEISEELKNKLAEGNGMVVIGREEKSNA